MIAIKQIKQKKVIEKVIFLSYELTRKWAITHKDVIPKRGHYYARKN